MKKLHRPTASFVTVAFVCSVCGCAPVDAPVLVYSYEEPDLAAPSGEVLRGVQAGDPVKVILVDGSNFDGTFEDIEEDMLSFSKIEWEDLSAGDQTIGLEVDRTSTCALEYVSEVYLRDEASIADGFLGWGSLIAIVLLFGAYAYGQGGDG